MKNNIEELYESIRLKIRAIYEENKKVQGNFDDANMKSYENLTFHVPDFQYRVDHKARMEKGYNKICNEWYILKYEIDEVMKKNLGDSFEKSLVCFCCQRDLAHEEIYSCWNGSPWLCQDEKNFGQILTYSELMEKIPDHLKPKK